MPLMKKRLPESSYKYFPDLVILEIAATLATRVLHATASSAALRGKLVRIVRVVVEGRNSRRLAAGPQQISL